MMGTTPDTRTYTRSEVESVVEQLKAINTGGIPVFTVHQEDGMRGIVVRVNTCLGWDTRDLFFKLDPSEPETEPARRARESVF